MAQFSLIVNANTARCTLYNNAGNVVYSYAEQGGLGANLANSTLPISSDKPNKMEDITFWFDDKANPTECYVEYNGQSYQFEVDQAFRDTVGDEPPYYNTDGSIRWSEVSSSQPSSTVTYEIRVDGETVPNGAYSSQFNGNKHRISLYGDGTEIVDSSIVWVKSSNGQTESQTARYLEERMPCSYDSLQATYDGQTVTISFEILSQSSNGWHIRIDDRYYGSEATIFARTSYVYSVYYGETKIESGVTEVGGIVYDIDRLGTTTRLVIESNEFVLSYPEPSNIVVWSTLSPVNGGDPVSVYLNPVHVVEPVSSFEWVGVSYESDV